LNFVRNRGELPVDKRPGVIQLDAHEIADIKAFDRGRVAASPNIIRLSPEIYITLEGRKPDNLAVGRDLNSIRVSILKAVLLDETLQGLVSSNGEIRYESCVTDLARGQNMDGEMGLVISFAYPLIPKEL
jgi:hypothetical protein